MDTVIYPVGKLKNWKSLLISMAQISRCDASVRTHLILWSTTKWSPRDAPALSGSMVMNWHPLQSTSNPQTRHESKSRKKKYAFQLLVHCPIETQRGCSAESPNSPSRNPPSIICERAAMPRCRATSTTKDSTAYLSTWLQWGGIICCLQVSAPLRKRWRCTLKSTPWHLVLSVDAINRVMCANVISSSQIPNSEPRCIVSRLEVMACMALCAAGHLALLHVLLLSLRWGWFLSSRF